MPLRPFDFADLPLEHAALRNIPDHEDTRSRLRERAERGPVPSCAAAVLAERSDPWAITTLSLLAPFLDRPDLEALGTATSTDAIACTVAAVNAPGPVRQAAVELIARMPPSSCAHAVLSELADHSRDPIAKAARGVASDMAMRLDRAARAESDRQRARGALVKTWTGIRRQELQREVATGTLAPCVAVVYGDADFLAGLVPPISDAVRPALVPALFAAARGADEQSRTRLFALFQGRFRDVAREPLSMLARFVALKGRDARVPALAVERLVAFGAWRDVVAAIVSGTSEVRNAALALLSPNATRTATDSDRDVVNEGAAWLEHVGDAAASERLRAAFAR